MSVEEQLAKAQQAETQRTHYRTLATAGPPSVKTNKAKPVRHHQRNGDRASPDDAAAAPRLPVYVRFNDLVAAGITRSWPSLLRLIRERGFPRGIMLGSHTRAWPLRDVEAWLAQRPVANNDVRLRGKSAIEETEMS